MVDGDPAARVGIWGGRETCPDGVLTNSEKTPLSLNSELVPKVTPYTMKGGVTTMVGVFADFSRRRVWSWMVLTSDEETLHPLAPPTVAPRTPNRSRLEFRSASMSDSKVRPIN